MRACVNPFNMWPHYTTAKFAGNALQQCLDLALEHLLR
jgi:hypothetical protein